MPLSSKVMLERSEYESPAAAAKKYVAQEKKERHAKVSGCCQQTDFGAKKQDR